MRAGDIDRASIIARASALVDKKLLIVGATMDVVSPLPEHFVPIVKALSDAGATALTDVVLDSDHRAALAQLVTAWMRAKVAA
ncbi:hypothetical protein [Rhodococcus sp. USK13]|uniref:hypothetical protein n=1 Tax=Rhodococcus sp. USK13 TaxID=2806442 RepID=UPI001BCC1BB8|nr:hypothetical protein [Rhodococcus sp. USK13]